jgi:hypothetical protein
MPHQQRRSTSLGCSDEYQTELDRKIHVKISMSDLANASESEYAHREVLQQ